MIHGTTPVPTLLTQFEILDKSIQSFRFSAFGKKVCLICGSPNGANTQYVASVTTILNSLNYIFLLWLLI